MNASVKCLDTFAVFDLSTGNGVDKNLYFTVRDLLLEARRSMYDNS
jgi:hypothetical protein